MGAFEAQLIPVKNGHEQEPIPIPDTGLVLGRDEDCDYPIHGDGISRRHARVVYVGDSLCVEDLESTNGIIVNGNQIQRRQILHPGDIMQICAHDFHIGGVVPLSKDRNWSQVAVLGIVFITLICAIFTWPLILSKSKKNAKKKFSEIRILSEPSEAEVYDHGKLLGTTPLDFDKVKHGDYRLLLRKRGYQDTEVLITVPQGITAKYHVLEPRIKGDGFLEVVTLPSGAKVYIDGKLAGQSESSEDAEMESRPLHIPNIDLSEEHIVYMEIDGRRSRTYRTQKWAEKVSLMIWAPDHLISMKNEDLKLGMVRRRMKNGDLLLAVAHDKDILIKSSDIKEDRPVPTPVFRYERGVQQLGDRQTGLELIVDPFPDTVERM